MILRHEGKDPASVQADGKAGMSDVEFNVITERTKSATFSELSKPIKLLSKRLPEIMEWTLSKDDKTEDRGLLCLVTLLGAALEEDWTLSGK